MLNIDSPFDISSTIEQNNTRLHTHIYTHSPVSHSYIYISIYTQTFGFYILLF